jgi:hypothetical protein
VDRAEPVGHVGGGKQLSRQASRFQMLYFTVPQVLDNLPSQFCITSTLCKQHTKNSPHSLLYFTVPQVGPCPNT